MSKPLLFRFMLRVGLRAHVGFWEEVHTPPFIIQCIATLLFDPSMSALPIIAKQNSLSDGLFTHQ